MQVLQVTVAAVAGAFVVGCATVPLGEPPTALLTGEEWIVEELAGRGVIDDARATLTFGADGRLSGSTSCNNYFAGYRANNGRLAFTNSGATKRACPPAVTDQESRFLAVLNAVSSYRFDKTGALILSTPAGTTMVARQASPARKMITYKCADGSTVEAWYPRTDTAKIRHNGREMEMKLAISASGARYVGDVWQWWTKGMSEGLLAPLAEGESIASASGTVCKAS